MAMVIPNDLVRRILAKLPVKSLVRFKCVSRMWLSIITEPFFAEAYRAAAGAGLLSYQPYWGNKLLHRWCFFYAGLEHDGVVLGHQVEFEEITGITNPVEGLVCFYRGKHSWLYNISTRETVQLPDSAAGSGDYDEYEYGCSPSYHFGYDKVNQRYKILKTTPTVVLTGIGKREGRLEILTIGVDSSWRRLENIKIKRLDSISLPPENITLESPCFGTCVLCWIQIHSNSLIAFDLAKEKFIHNIPKPSKPRRVRISIPDWVLMNFGPDIGISSTGELKQILRFVPYCDDDLDRGGVWVDELPELHQKLDEEEEEPTALGVIPDGSGKMVIYDGKGTGVYLFDRSKREWGEKMKMNISPSAMALVEDTLFIPDIFHRGMYYHPNIIPLKCLI